MILAIDTSTDQAGVALHGSESVRQEWSWHARGNHSMQLTDVIRRMLGLEALVPADLTGLVVALGPGSFSGVRVGLSEAKGLAFGAGLPLAGVSTLDAIGFQACGLSADVLAVIPAGRDQVYWARYAGQGPDWHRISDYQIGAMSQVAGMTGPETLLAGEAATAIAGLRRIDGLASFLAPLAWQLRRAGFLAELGSRKLAQSGGEPLEALEPLYLRLSAAEEKRAGSKV